MRAEGPVILLQTQTPHEGRSFLVGRPHATLKAFGNRIERRDADGETKVFQQNPWEALRDFRREHGGWVFCILGYDLKNADEALSSSNEDLFSLPDLLAFSPGVLVVEEAGRRRVLMGGVPEKKTAPDGRGFEIRGLAPTVDERDYIGLIARIKDDIHEGEYYELNLSHPLRASFAGDPFGLYEAMRLAGPVPMAAFVACEDVSVCCASPERYLRREGTRVVSEPIKGTRPRSADAAEDARLRNELANSEKDRAENLMIVDLVRHDLSRVAKPGSVRVTDLLAIRSFATVHQMVSEVEAEVEAHTDPVDILRATFPMGSMTGAPKIRVMQAIERYETYRRGWYSGAIGYIAPDGDFDFNVVIRTAVIRGDRLVYPVGGAITSDSDPNSEWDETWVKAKALQHLTLTIGH